MFPTGVNSDPAFRGVTPALRRRLAAAALSVAVLAAACGSGDSETADGADTPVDDGASAPAEWPHDFTADLVGGGTIDAGDFEGQDLVLWFWAPW